MNSLLPRAAFGQWEVVELSCRGKGPVFRESPKLGSAAASSWKGEVLSVRVRSQRTHDPVNPARFSHG